MTAVAKALVETVVSMRMAAQEDINPDAAQQIIEMIAAQLQEATPQEKAVLQNAISELVASEQGSLDRPEVVDAYQSWLASMGLEAV